MIRLFSHYLPASAALMFLVEVSILAVALAVALNAAPLAAEFTDTRVLPQYSAPVVLALLLGLVMVMLSLYRRDRLEVGIGAVPRLVAALALGLGAATLAYELYPPPEGVPQSVLIALLSGFGVIAFTRTAFVHWRAMGILQSRILVLGAGSRAAKIDELLMRPWQRRRPRVIGYLSAGGSTAIAAERLLDGSGSMLELAQRHGITEIVLALRNRRGGALPMAELVECRLRGIRITDLSSFFERERGQIRLDSLNASWLVHGDGFRQGLLRSAIKRSFDWTVSATLLLITMPIMLLTAAAIILYDRGPVFYTQERTGRHGRPFQVFKFRSMRQDAEGAQPQWAQAGDDRVTPIGRLIRRLRIDELPQIINILRGDMSFVGPRPERPYFVEQLKAEVPFYCARHSVKPGLTGWAQVRYPYGASQEDAVEKLQYDLYYVKNHTLFLDLVILFETVQVVLLGRGVR